MDDLREEGWICERGINKRNGMRKNWKEWKTNDIKMKIALNLIEGKVWCEGEIDEGRTTKKECLGEE